MLAAGMDSGTGEDRRGINVIDFGKVETVEQAMPTLTAACDLGGEVSATALDAATFRRFCTPQRAVNTKP